MVPEAGRKRVLGDAELILLFRDGAAAPGGQRLRMLAGEIETALAAAGVVCRVDLATVCEDYFRSLPPSVFGYELRACGKVLWGEDAIRLIRPEVGAGVTVEDAFRLLWNRTIELLGTLGQGLEAHYAAAKLYLDMATSFLVFSGGYAPSYQARRRRVRELAGDSAAGGEWPFPPMEFADRLDRSTDWKLSGDGSPEGWEFCKGALRHARALARWELMRMAGCPADAGDVLLWEKWRRSQPWSLRLRGWLYVARACGWQRSWRMWPRWLRRAPAGSPRTWIYGAAHELLSHVDALPQGPALSPAAVHGVAAALPLPPAGDGGGWPELCRAVFANYKDFLVGTRC